MYNIRLTICRKIYTRIYVVICVHDGTVLEVPVIGRKTMSDNPGKLTTTHTRPCNCNYFMIHIICICLYICYILFYVCIHDYNEEDKNTTFRRGNVCIVYGKYNNNARQWRPHMSRKPYIIIHSVL